MDILSRHVEILGKKVRCKVTGFEGVASSVCFDLYGCVQVAVSPPIKDGDIKDGRWFDIQRLDIVTAERVMPVPSFESLLTADGVHAHGPAEKPVR
jgi:hypothetical protein